MIGLEALLRRERTVVAGAVVLLTGLAWMYVWRGAGMGMSARDMTALTLFPHLRPDLMTAMPAAASGWITVVVMWWTMMIAMMTPSIAPLLLLYGRVLRQKVPEPQPAYAAPIVLAAGYLVSWLAFSIAATGLQYALRRAGLISATMLWSRSGAFSAAVLIATGVYQLTPLKHACLRHCRGPVEFLTRYFRPGRTGAFLLGVRHGTWCMGCCWMLMALLFVGGVMNIVWIALLTLLVIAEKLTRAGALVSRASGIALIIWGAATVWV